MMRAQFVSLSLLIALPMAAAAGCRSSGQPGSDAGSGLDGRLPSGWRFTPEDEGQSPAVALDLITVSGSDATLILIGRGFAKLQGVAFRLTFPPQQVQVIRTEIGAAWTATLYPVLSRFATRAEGEVWGGVGHRGSRGLDAYVDTELAGLVLRLSGAAPIKLAFRPHFNACYDPDLKRLDARWLGGTFEPVFEP